MQRVRIENIGGEIIKDTSQYLLKDNPFGEHLTLSSTMLRANESTNGHTHDDHEEGFIVPVILYIIIDVHNFHSLPGYNALRKFQLQSDSGNVISFIYSSNKINQSVYLQKKQIVFFRFDYTHY